MPKNELQNTREIADGLFISTEAVDDLNDVLSYHEAADKTKLFEMLGFEEGAYVKTKESSEVGEIISIEKIDTKTGINYILTVNFLDGEEEIDLLSVPYESLFGEDPDEDTLLETIKANANLEIVDPDDAEMIVELQEAIFDMSDDEFWDFVESGEIADAELPHIKDFVSEETERRAKGNA